MKRYPKCTKQKNIQVKKKNYFLFLYFLKYRRERIFSFFKENLYRDIRYYIDIRML